MTLPVALSGHDIIGQAKTGTGKTLGFGVPMLHRVVAPGDDGYESCRTPGKPQALVVVPTRELAVQVAGDLERAGKQPRRPRAHRLRRPRLRAADRGAARRGVDVVVGTPGPADRPGQAGAPRPRRRRGPSCSTRPTRCSTSASCPTSRRCWPLTPAGAPDDAVLRDHAGRRRRAGPPLHDASRRTSARWATTDEDAHTVKAIEQFVYRAHAMDKVEMLARILQADGPRADA